MQAPKKTILVTLSGAMGSVASATIDGTRYTQEITVKAETVSFTVNAVASSDRSLCYIKLDGATVLRGAGTYQYMGKNNIKATFSMDTGNNGMLYGMCDIVTV